MELSTAGFAGVILDENGNVIDQPDESLGYERLYPINSHLILSIRAKTGFDGKSASMCVLEDVYKRQACGSKCPSSWHIETDCPWMQFSCTGGTVADNQRVTLTIDRSQITGKAAGQ